MEPTSFTFVNTTDTPSLSRQAAKLMRGHVTRINFTNRRQRKADAKSAEIAYTRGDVGLGSQLEENGRSKALPLLAAASDLYYYAQLCMRTLNITI